MSFYEFMIENYINDETPLGDLARDMRDDKEMPENKNNDERIFQYLDFKIRDTIVEEIFEEAKKEYKKYKEEK